MHKYIFMLKLFMHCVLHIMHIVQNVKQNKLAIATMSMINLLLAQS